MKPDCLYIVYHGTWTEGKSIVFKLMKKTDSSNMRITVFKTVNQNKKGL
jgi:hypothetical protein